MTQKPSSRNKLLGDRIAVVRTARGLSRAKLVSKVLGLLDADDDRRALVSESVLREIEEGNRVTVPRALLELLVQALDCSLSERLDILLAADRNVFATSNGHTPEPANVLLRSIALLYETDPLVKTQVEMLLGDRHAALLDADELLSILEKVITVAAARLRRGKNPNHPTTLQPPR
jgi:transcriptional regulator with XRE-family HTH domain